MRHKPLAALAAVLAAGLLLCGCLVPERYISRVKVERDGTYRLFAEGTAVDPETVYALRTAEYEIKTGKVKAEDVKKRREEAEGKIRAALDRLKADKRVSSATSIGGGRVRFSLDGTWKIDRNVLVLQELDAPLSYAVAPDGTIRIRVKDALPGPEAKALGLKTDGDVSVVLAEGIEVLEDNAERKPKTAYGAFRWHIGDDTTAAPYLKIRLPAGGAAPPAAASSAPAPQKGLVGHGEKR